MIVQARKAAVPCPRAPKGSTPLRSVPGFTTTWLMMSFSRCCKSPQGPRRQMLLAPRAWKRAWGSTWRRLLLERCSWHPFCPRVRMVVQWLLCLPFLIPLPKSLFPMPKPVPPAEAPVPETGFALPIEASAGEIPQDSQASVPAGPTPHRNVKTATPVSPGTPVDSC